MRCINTNQTATIGQLASAVGTEGATRRYLENFAYFYDAAGNLTRRDNTDMSEWFTPNDLNELAGASRGGPVPIGGFTGASATSVTVSANGGGGSSATLYSDSTFALRFLTLANGNNTITAIAADSLGRHDTNTISLNLPSSISYSYDQNGNLTGDGRRTMLYDDQNQLISIIVTNGVGSSTRTTNVFDGLGRRQIRREFIWQSSAWAQTAEMRYIYDGMLPIQERDGNNIPSVTYTRGTDFSGGIQGAGGIGGLLARTDHSTITPSHAYYHCDGNGNITTLINERQLIAARYIYSPFGGVTRKTGPLADANTYRFSSKEFHNQSATVYYLYRYYDPNLQRWLNRDPIGEESDKDLFRFCGNNAILCRDNFELDRSGVECRGGKLVPQYGSPGDANDPCVAAHEKQHVKDWNAYLGEDFCKTKPDGFEPTAAPDFIRNSECNAFQAEADLAKDPKSCLTKDQKSACERDAYYGKLAHNCPGKMIKIRPLK